MLVTDAGIVIVYMLAFSNAQPPIVVNVDPLANVTVDRLRQREKADCPISVIVLGIVILCNPELSKHVVHIFVQPDGIVNCCRFEQSWNIALAFVPSVVQLGRVMVCTPLALKAFANITNSEYD